MKKKLKIKYPDYPLEEIVKTAEVLVKQGMDVYQKWTCEHCGSRQTMGDKNSFFMSGECEECEQITIIHKCNYMVHAQGAATDVLLKEMFKK